MQALKQTLVVAVMLSLSACSWTQSVRPMVPTNVPEVCLTKCPQAPKPKDGSDRELRFWEFGIIDAFGECRRMHEECVNWHIKEK